MKDVFEFIAQLVPPSMRVPALLGVILLYLYPHLRSSWLDFHYRTAFLDYTKRQLEILKLSCEIEGLRRTHQLTDTRFALPQVPLTSTIVLSLTKRNLQQGLPRLAAGLFAAAGCMTSLALGIGLTFAIDSRSFSEFAGLFYFFHFLAALIICIIAGSVAALRSYRTRPYSIVIGLLFPWTIWAILNLSPSYAGLVSPVQ